MSRPLQPVSHSDPGRLSNSQTKEACEAKPPEARHLSYLSARENVPEMRNLQSKLCMKESSLQEMKTELESYKETNAQQALQIMSLRDDIKNLQDLIDSLMKIKILKNTKSQNFGRHNQDLTERVIDLENRLREHLLRRELAERKAELLEKRRSCPSRFSPHKNLKGPEDSLDIFPVKDNDEICNFERDNIVYSEGPIDGQIAGDKCQQDLIHKEKLTSELDRAPYSCSWETTAEQSHHQDFLGQLATLLSDNIGPILATEEAVKERIQEMGANEQSWKCENSRTRTAHTDKHSKVKQFEMLVDLEQNSKMAAAPRMEEKIRRLQKQLSDLKLSNKNMKTQLTRISVLKDRTIERLRQSVAKVETVKEKTAAKTDNLKTPSDPAEPAARPDKERAHQVPARSLPEPSTVRGVLKGVSGREQELADFRETIMKMLGFNMKTADKDVINQLKLVVQIYEISKRSKTASHCEPGPAK
uniref:uncharacterized protein LOC117697498 isoform X5 n=1 Tax=Arvicanthis niloticus TaxID=61156 RepID=UPI0014872BC3|nr:uncharacterized protein LOC117697498 isoform X5 [Arvicanthis niloticus]